MSRSHVVALVHYVSHGTPVREDGTQAYPSACRAAVVTETYTDDPDAVGLSVLNPTGQFFNQRVPYGPPLAASTDTDQCGGVVRAGGTWHEPIEEQTG